MCGRVSASPFPGRALRGARQDEHRETCIARRGTVHDAGDLCTVQRETRHVARARMRPAAERGLLPLTPFQRLVLLGRAVWNDAVDSIPSDAACPRRAADQGCLAGQGRGSGPDCTGQVVIEHGRRGFRQEVGPPIGRRRSFFQWRSFASQARSSARTPCSRAPGQLRAARASGSCRSWWDIG
jgi:hypothetical protein